MRGEGKSSQSSPIGSPEPVSSPASSRPRKVGRHSARRGKRVTRACDNCRLRKTRCDGTINCETCASGGHECTYDRPGRARPIDVRYVRELERRIEKLNAFLGQQPSTIAGRPSIMEPDDIRASGTAVDSLSQPLLETMAYAAGEMEVDESGECHYLGSFSGLSFQKRIQETCYKFIGCGASLPMERASIGRMALPPGTLPCRFLGDSRPLRESVFKESSAMMPAKEIAIELSALAFDNSFSLLQFIHFPTFTAMVDDIYTGSSLVAGPDRKRHLALLYQVLAVGKLSAYTTSIQWTDESLKNSKEAYGYFRTGQEMIDITDCRDLVTLQAMICMVVYLHASAAISSCYPLITLCLAACARMGLHRKAVQRNFSQVEVDIRKHAFWAVRTMEAYISTILGLPTVFTDDEVDQVLPTDVSEEFTRKNTTSVAGSNPLGYIQAANAHTHLIAIMRKVKRYVHGGFRDIPEDTSAYRVNYGRIKEVESDLESWLALLPKESDLPNPIPRHQAKEQLLLRLAYAHVQMVLYRPFLHHVAKRRTDKDFNFLALACASACINAAMHAVWVNEALEAQGLVSGTQWFLCYITFFAVSILLLFSLSSEDDPTAPNARLAAQEGYRMLKALARSSFTARQFIKYLDPVFQKLSAKEIYSGSAYMADKAAVVSPLTQQVSDTFPATKQAQSTLAVHDTSLAPPNIPTPGAPTLLLSDIPEAFDYIQTQVGKQERLEQDLQAFLYDPAKPFLDPGGFCFLPEVSIDPGSGEAELFSLKNELPYGIGEVGMESGIVSGNLQ